jgi:hypothetical protein
MIQQGNLLEPSLNPLHDTKPGNKTTCITVYIHRMILDMIQEFGPHVNLFPVPILGANWVFTWVLSLPRLESWP